MANKIPVIKLNNGIEMPALGFGTFAKEGIAGKCYDAVLVALDAGYRHLDCALYYENEDEVGQALKKWLSDNPTRKRSDIFITTKVWPQNMEPEDVEWSINKSLTDLGVDYVDSFLIHWPFAVERTEDHKVKLNEKGQYILKPDLTADLSPAWCTLEKLYASGKTRSIGVSNYTISHLESLLAYAKVIPALNQVELHPFLPSTSLLDFMSKHSIAPVAYSPLGSQHQCPTTGEKVLENKVINDIAQEKGVDVAQVCVSWGISKGWGVLPKSGQASRIKRNFQIIELSKDEMTRLDGLAEARGGETRFVNPIGTFGFDFFGEGEQGV